ncbi:MAG: hypothetical protein JOY62_09300 [Acidobacteriaceae bacterium]|nr:hypothetical protein [Acidobacteriaceae bacterium]MBV9780155.1 hypothetical protein [Acidobacteriaceae bacterium]
MQPALLIRLSPIGPWRYGPGDGARTRVDKLFRSDRLYSAVSIALRQLEFLEEWLDATVRGSIPALTFSSLFPYQGDTLFANPPSSLWPPSSSSVSMSSPAFLTKIRWEAPRFVPLSLIESLFTGETILADQWIADPESGCLLRRDRPNASPFRRTVRNFTPVDRLTKRGTHSDACACVEFEPGSGVWAVARFADQSAEAAWKERLKAAFRLLADTGFGGRRSSGWGQMDAPEFREGTWPHLVFPKLRRASLNGDRAGSADNQLSLYWLLSLYSPSPEDRIDWSGGQYLPVVRGGRVESPAGSGIEKKLARMISEGSVLAANSEPVGAGVDVAPDGFGHPVYRSGLALALKLPVSDELAQAGPVEVPTDKDFEERPCEEPAAAEPEAGASEAEPAFAERESLPEQTAEENEPVNLEQPANDNREPEP